VTQYGWTVGRIWLAASVLLACGYAAGYVYAVVTRGPWLSRIERWNFVMSLATLTVLVALFTPIASPARIAVADQMARLKNGRTPISKFDFRYLRWEGGRYGKDALTALAASKDGYTKKAAEYALLQTNKYGSLSAASPSFVGRLTVYPRGQTLPQSFVHMDWNKEGRVWLRPDCPATESCDAILADLDGDNRPEVLILAGRAVLLQVFREDGNAGWSQAGTIALPPNCPALVEALRQGHFSMSPPASRWNDIQLSGLRLHMREVDFGQSQPKCPA
jgi:hypothetical protein